MAFILNYRLLFRGGPETEWVDHDPVLLAREPGINTTTGGMKIGDGRKKWSQLDYVFGGEDYNLTPGTITSGGTAAATITGKAPHQQLNLTLPYGPRGLQGEKGDTGAPGPAPTFTAGPVTTSAPGTAAAATITGTNGTYTLNLTIPRGNTGTTGQQGQQGVKGDKGEKGDRGDVGPSTNIAIGTVTTSTTTPNATITGTAPNQTLNLAIPRGDKGDTGAPGPGNSITPGSITTGAPGTNAAATITGTSPNQVLNLTIPRGDRGQIGPPGPAPTFTAAAPTNLPPGTTPTATISGTDGAYTLNLGIPRGYDGSGVPGGGATGQLLRKNSVTDYDVEWFTPTWAPATHTHAWADISEKPAAYPPATHTHLYEDMVGTVPTGQLPWANDSTPGILDPVLYQRIVGANQYGVAGTLVRRDDAGRAQFADPAADNDATSKRYVDTGLAGKANTTHTHAATDITGTIPAGQLPLASAASPGALSATHFTRLSNAATAPTGNALALRDADGRAQFADPVAAADAATRGYLDSRLRSLTVSVKDFGATGNGTTDDTAAINAAIQSLPANGGAVYFPSGTYKISDNIVSRNALVMTGDGSSSTVIWQTNTTKHGLLCNDQLYLTIQGLALVGPTTGTGIGINLMRTNNAASNYIKMDDVRLRTWGRDGLAGSNIIVSSWNNVTAVQNGRHGFNIWGTNGISTSISMDACYANENKGNGFQIANSTYISMNGCASEKNQIDYQFTACQGVTLAGCGSEQSVTNAIVVSGGEAITINGWVYARKGEGVRIKNNAKGVVLNVAETNDTPPTTPALVVEAGSEYVDLGSQWKGEVQVAGTNTLHTQIDARTTKPRATAINVTAPPYNADPTGLTDATQAIQNAVNAAATLGVGAVEIPAGYYKVSAPFITLKAGVLVYGHGDSTVIVATGPAPTEKIGVFHIGTYNNRAQDPNLFRAGLRDLMIKTTSANQSHQDIINNVCGVILNTDLGSGPKDPDAVHTLRGLTIWDMHIGMAILGRDDQGMKISDIRIRGGNECGLLVGKPSDHPEVIAGVPGGPGGADNKFLNADVSSANRLGGTRAGIEVHTSNTKFVNSTSWYNRRFGSFEGTAALDRAKFRDGAGWYIKATKNVFIGCTAQENGGHGFITEWPGTQFIACIAESNSYTDAVNAPAKVQEASGFVICNGASDTQVIACRSGNARGTASGQAYGYVVENYAKNQWIESTADQNAKGEVLFGTNPSSMNNVVIRVGSTLHGWPGGAGGTPDWADITGKPTTFAPTTHNHTAAQITTGTLDPARLPLSTTTTAGAMSAADKTKLDGITGSGGGTSLTPTETATLATLTDALTKTTAERTAYTNYQTLLDQRVVSGTVLTTSSAEDGASKWDLNYQSTLETNPALADDGSSYIRLPANNNNPNPSKPVHAYLLQPVSVTTGRTYALHARVRSTGTVGADDYFRVMIGRYSGSGNPTYVDASSPVPMAPKGVNANGYVDIVGTWTANVTGANIIFGVQGGFLANDLLVDRVSILDTTGATQVTDQQVDDARAAWQTAAAASNAAWRNMMPVGALTGAGGGVTTQTISRVDYEARRAAGTLDPNILYMVSAA